MTTLPPEDPNLPHGTDATASQPPVSSGPPSSSVPPPGGAGDAAGYAPSSPAEPPAGGPAPNGYQSPPTGAHVPPPGYQATGPGYQQPSSTGHGNPPAADPVGNITLNYWLSVFFVWIPALIFYIIEKDKGNPQAYAFHRDNLNFSLVRTIAYVAIVVIGWIPYIGWLLALLIWIGQIVLFIFHIMAAAKAPEAYRRGEQPPFIFNLPLVK